MNGHLTLIVAAAAANIVLGAAVLGRKPRNNINRYFALFSFFVAAWTLSNGLALADPTSESALFLARLAFASASAIPLAFLLFSSVFPTDSPSPPPRVLQGFRLLGSVFTLTSFTPWILKDVTSSNGSLQAAYGPLHLAFGLYFVSCLSFSLFILTQKLTVLTGFQKLQVRYLFFGVLTAALGATVTSLAIPLLIGSSQFSRYGPLFGLVMIAMIAHSIIRHRLMNIRLVVRQGSVYLIAATIAGGVFTIIVVLASHLVGGRPEDVPLALQVAVALAIALAFQPLKGSLQSWLDRYLYRESYDYQRLIRAASRTIGATLDFRSLLQYLCEVTHETLKPDSVAVFARENPSDAFSLAASISVVESDNRQRDKQLSAASPLPSFLALTRRPLLGDEVGRQIVGDSAQAAGTHLGSLGGDVAVPILSESSLIGFLVVGPKLSGDAYFIEDVELLSTLASQASIAVSNAQLYRQVVLINEYIENILRTMDSGVITIDGTGRVAVCNSTAERLTGLSRSLLTSLTVKELPTALSSQLQATLTDGQPRLQVEATLPNDSLQLIPVVSSTSALTDNRGTILGALVVFSDLSKLKALESEKRRAERLAAFGTLVSGIAHEIKNPLVAIKTFAELLPERFAETDFREDFSKVVITEIDRIDDLVARLRGLAAPSPQSSGPVDLRESIIDTLALLRAQLEHTRTIVHREFEDSAPHVVIDASQLKQLFLNLFLNAIEAMGPGGELTIRVSRKATQNGDWVVAEVSDTGPGIPESIRSSIFDPFFTTKPRGSGLGLAICRGIMDAHKGTIHAENHGKGTTVVVELPAMTEAERLTEEQVLRG